jgi:hypothetical protein
MDLPFATSPQEGSSREVPFHILQTEAECIGIKLFGGGAVINSTFTRKQCGFVSELWILFWSVGDALLRIWRFKSQELWRQRKENFPSPRPKAYRGVNKGIAPLILNLGTRWKWVFKFRLRALYFRDSNPGPSSPQRSRCADMWRCMD